MTSPHRRDEGQELVDDGLAQPGRAEVEPLDRVAAEGDTSGTYLDLYKLAVEMADRVSVRRAAANTFFFTIHAALLTFSNVAKPTAPASDAVPGGGQLLDKAGLVMVAVVGLLLAGAWWFTLRSYRDLNRAKFVVINAMEERLPARIFTQEWMQLSKRAGLLGRYTEFGMIERVVPLLFGAMYLITIALVLTE
jgi:hypothetical protein